MRKSTQIAYFALIAVCLIGGVAKTIAGDIYPAILSTSTAVWLAFCFRDAKIVTMQEELINELLAHCKKQAEKIGELAKHINHQTDALQESQRRERIAQKVIADLREKDSKI